MKTMTRSPAIISMMLGCTDIESECAIVVLRSKLLYPIKQNIYYLETKCLVPRI